MNSIADTSSTTSIVFDSKSAIYALMKIAPEPKRSRGRPPKPENTGKTAMLGIRVSPTTKARLEHAAKSSGMSLAAEVESRLRDSLDEPDRVTESFGGRTTFALMQFIADQISGIERATGECWLDDRWTFDECVTLINAILKWASPRSERELPEAMRRRVQSAKLLDEKYDPEHLGQQRARGAIDDLESVSPQENLASRSEPGGIEHRHGVGRARIQGAAQALASIIKRRQAVGSGKKGKGTK